MKVRSPGCAFRQHAWSALTSEKLIAFCVFVHVSVVRLAIRFSSQAKIVIVIVIVHRSARTAYCAAKNSHISRNENKSQN